MKNFLSFINRLTNVYELELQSQSMNDVLESIIQNFISNNYEKVKQQKYAWVVYDDVLGRATIVINPYFEMELIHHYPEKMI